MAGSKVEIQVRLSSQATLRLAFALLASFTSLHADDWLDQVWPEAKIYIKTGPTSRVYLQYAPTRTRGPNSE